MTWPIVAMSYFYVRKDLSFLKTPEEQSLLVTLLREFFFDLVQISKCSKFGFTPVSQSVRKLSLDGIKMLNVSSDAPVWFMEKDTVPGIGQGNYVVSHKRRSYAKYERGVATGSREAQADTVSMLQEEVVSISEWMFISEDVDRLNLALGLAASSIALWGIAIVVGVIVMLKK